MKARRFAEDGFTLPEILISLAVFCILTTLGFAAFSRQKNQLQRQDAARQLKISLERAKFDSIKRHALTAGEMSGVTILSPTSFRLATDLNSDGNLDATEYRRITLPSNGDVKIIGNNLVFPVSVKFNYRGQVTATDGNNSPITPTFTVGELISALKDAGADNSNIVTVSPSGTVSLLDGGKAAANIAEPSVKDTGVDQKINQDIVIRN